MTSTMKNIAIVLGALALALSSVACAAPADEEGAESTTGALASGGGGGSGGAGFVCGLNICSCDPGSSDPAEACLGLDQLCKRLTGHPATTKSDGTKECLWAITAPPTPTPIATTAPRAGASRVGL